MTPKEKAKELLDKMNNRPIENDEWEIASDYAKNDLKRKVLIAVDELINHCHVVNIVYWQEVKQEIIKSE